MQPDSEGSVAALKRDIKSTLNLRFEAVMMIFVVVVVVAPLLFKGILKLLIMEE